MKKSVKRIMGVVLCATMLFNPISANFATHQISANAAMVSTFQTQSKKTPYTISKVSGSQDDKLNFTIKSDVPFNVINKYHSFKDYAGKRLVPTGFQVVMWKSNSLWSTPNNYRGVKGGYFATAGIPTKTARWSSVDFSNVGEWGGIEDCLVNYRYLKLAIVPVRREGCYTRFAAPQYYSDVVYYDFYDKCMVSEAVACK